MKLLMDTMTLFACTINMLTGFYYMIFTNDISSAAMYFAMCAALASFYNMEFDK